MKLEKTLKDFKLERNSLIRDIKSDKKEKLELEIGDVKQVDEFLPQIKLKKWDNEINLSVRRVKEWDNPVIETRGEKIQYGDDKETVVIYEKPNIAEDGGLEIELHLHEKPATNRFEFSIRTKGLKFLYQPALTQEEIEQGYKRPENVVGSYAVYHESLTGNFRDKHYKTGKAFHIYRPYIFDEDGNETWGELEIDIENETLTVIVPEHFLEQAKYPVIVDPTFGYTSAGASSHEIFHIYSSEDNVPGYASRFALPSPGGPLTSMSAYIDSSSAVIWTTVGMHIYEDTANEPDNRLGTTGQSPQYTNTSPAWVSADFTSPLWLTPGNYWMTIGYWSSSNYGMGTDLYYDDGAGMHVVQNYSFAGPYMYGTPQGSPDPWAAVDSTGTRNYSIYATYYADQPFSGNLTPRLTTSFDGHLTESFPAFVLSPSSNITASGENTTAQLTAPSGKTTGDFTAGRMQDDENPADSINLGDDEYTEVEWSIEATQYAIDEETYEFRVTDNGVVLDTYTDYPEWTTPAASTGSNDSRDAEVSGIDTDASTIDAEVAGAFSSSSPRDAEVRGVDSSTSTRDAELTGTSAPVLSTAQVGDDIELTWTFDPNP